MKPRFRIIWQKDFFNVVHHRLLPINQQAKDYYENWLGDLIWAWKRKSFTREMAKKSKSEE